jgi:uncharacterized cupredoxin-like copper-binding protein
LPPRRSWQVSRPRCRQRGPGACQPWTVTAGKPAEFHFGLTKKTVPKGTVTFLVVNKGNVPHDFKINGHKTKLLTPGQAQTLKVTFLKAGKYPFLCTVTGHAAAGMKGTFTVS